MQTKNLILHEEDGRCTRPFTFICTLYMTRVEYFQRDTNHVNVGAAELPSSIEQEKLLTFIGCRRRDTFLTAATLLMTFKIGNFSGNTINIDRVSCLFFLILHF